MGLDNEDIKQLIAILQRGLNKQEDGPEEETVLPKTKKKRQHKIIETKRKKGQEITQNKFLDMPESRMHKEDSTIDKLLAKQPPVVRTRGYQPITVSCRVCGKKEDVNPALVVEGAARYKCNKCSTTEG